MLSCIMEVWHVKHLFDPPSNPASSTRRCEEDINESMKVYLSL